MTKADFDRFHTRPLVLASRKSALAMIQARSVQDALRPCPSEILGLSTTGDEILDRPLVDIGGKGVFIKTLEAALLDGRADAAVHSMKDMETSIAPGTKIAAVLPREDRRDALVGPYNSLSDLPEAAHIGTASVRRAALLRNRRPDLQTSLLRGNVGSRLARLESGEFDAIILAAAGLRRLGQMTGYTILDEDVMPPAAAQGALAVQIRTGTGRAACVAAALAGLNCADSALCVKAERAVLAGLDGSCRTPVTAMADIVGRDCLRVRASVLSADGRQCFTEEQHAGTDRPEWLGQNVAAALLAACGGPQFLA